MINLQNKIRIVQLDSYNMTFEVYRETKKTSLNKEPQFKWIQEGGYYGTLEQCLKAIKDYIIKTENNTKEYIDIINVLDGINNLYVTCEIKVR